MDFNFIPTEQIHVYSFVALRPSQHIRSCRDVASTLLDTVSVLKYLINYLIYTKMLKRQTRVKGDVI